MSIAVIDAAELMDGDDDHLKVLMSAQPQGQLLMKAIAAAAGGQGILLDPPALEVHHEYDVGSDDDAAIEQNIRVQQLIYREQQDDRRQDPHHPAHRKTDALPVAQSDIHQHEQLDPHDSVTHIDQRSPAVHPVFIKVEEDAAVQVVQDQRKIKQV